jgi:uncharacterized protein (DUF58 family)
VAVTACVSALLDVRIGLALAFVLGLTACVSLVLLRRFRAESIKVSPAPGHVTSFKGDGRSVGITFGSRLFGWSSVALLPLVGDDRFEARLTSSSAEAMELVLKPRYAGRFEGLKFELELSDLFGLFVIKAIPLDVKIIFDSLPASLLELPPRARLSPLSLGERSSGSPGSGQEFYGIDEYQPFMEAKNILWRRVGRRADDKLVVKVRESNIPREVRIALVIPQGDGILGFVDLACEALGQLCGSFLEAGSIVTLVGFDGSRVVTVSASKPEELPSALMEASTMQGGPVDLGVLSDADVVVMDSASISLPRAMDVAAGNALLVISERELPDLLSRRVFVFTGHEELSRLAELVMNR